MSVDQIQMTDADQPVRRCPVEFDWKAARRSRPYAGDGKSGGKKTTARCPHCGGSTYGYHGGRFKQCPACGFHRQMEKAFDILRYAAMHDTNASFRPSLWRAAIDYWNRVYGVRV